MSTTTTDKPVHKLFEYPERFREAFSKTPGITFGNGDHVTAAEIWDYMTLEAPVRFPHSFDTSNANQGRLSSDVEFFSGIKRAWFSISLKDRALKAHANGVPLVLTQGGQTMEPYYAAGGIPLRPGLVMQWARDMQEGLSLRESDARGVEILESGRNRVSIDACNQIAAHAAIDNGVVPISLVAPYLALRCSDMAYLTESHRNHKRKLPMHLVDFPIDQVGKPWAADLVATELRKLVAKISEFSGKKVTDDDLWQNIRYANTARGLAREIHYLVWNAPELPINSADLGGIPHLANDFMGDPVATLQLLELIRDEVKDRIERGVRGAGVHKDPKRLFICGSCVGPNQQNVERAGGYCAGRDDSWNLLTLEVEEKGDPYQALAKSILSYPYEQPTEKRAEWTIQAVRDSKAKGVIFMYQWGCNYQSGVSRMISDIVKEKTGLPATFIEVGELGRSEATEQSENRVEAFLEMI